VASKYRLKVSTSGSSGIGFFLLHNKFLFERQLRGCGAIFDIKCMAAIKFVLRLDKFSSKRVAKAEHPKK